MNVKNFLKTLAWCPLADLLIPQSMLSRESTPEEKDVHHALHQVFSYGFMPCLAGMAYLLILGKIFPFVYHLINDTSMMDWYMFFFTMIATGFMINFGHKTFKLLKSSGTALSQKNQEVAIAIKSHGLTTHNEHLQEAALLDIVHHTFGSATTHNQHKSEHGVEKEKE